jgi:hypothetical protein
LSIADSALPGTSHGSGEIDKMAAAISSMANALQLIQRQISGFYDDEHFEQYMNDTDSVENPPPILSPYGP